MVGIGILVFLGIIFAISLYIIIHGVIVSLVHPMDEYGPKIEVPIWICSHLPACFFLSLIFKFFPSLKKYAIVITGIYVVLALLLGFVYLLSWKGLNEAKCNKIEQDKD